MSKIFFFLFLISFVVSYGCGRYVYQRSKEGNPLPPNSQQAIVLHSVLWGVLSFICLLVFGSTLND